uniref:exodeoxyribonuclease III n=1 Tax=Acanthochromis polyacanthus TaxID=80966 RepID=A0A3Q1EIT7_9TELE
MVNFISLNVNGLLSTLKQNKLLTKLKRENIDIAFLQDTHMPGKEHERLKKHGFKYMFSSSNGSKHTRGVAILMSGKLVYEHISTSKDREGRFILIKGRLNRNLFTLYNVYIPPGSKSEFYIQILDRIATEAQGTLICRGDFNITLNPHLDSWRRRISQSQKTTKKLTSMISELGLILRKQNWRDPEVHIY